jgi:alpha-tubulin suppressor-like RCC1 family protein
MAVNESNTIQYTVTTTNTADGTTLYWKTTGNTTNADIVGGNTGSITITNNQAIFNVTIASDANTDGPKTLGITILTGSLSGTPVVNTASTILINDTSLTPDNRLFGWGQNQYGSLSYPGNNYRSSPTQIGTETTWSKISNSGYTVLANKTDGTMWSWGAGAYGVLGLDIVGTNYKSSPTQIGTGTTWSQVAIGKYSAFAVKTDGTMWSWGNNSQGELGSNNRVYRSSPVQVGSDTNWSQPALGSALSLAIKSNGTIWFIGGRNDRGTSGLNLGNATRSSPTQIGAGTTWSKISVSETDSLNETVFAIKTDGTLWGWGSNNLGQLGLNIINSYGRSSPTQIGTGTTWSLANAARAGGFAIKTDGTLWVWGYFNNGSSGTNIDTFLVSSPIQIGALTNWSKVNSGKYHTTAIKTDGTLWTWGQNDAGELGQNNRVMRSSPVQVGTGTWSEVSPGYMSISSNFQTIAITQ